MKVFSICKQMLSATLDERLTPALYPTFSDSPVFVYDIGAAGGVYTPYISGPKQWAQIIAFEPHEGSYKKLQKKHTSKHVKIFPFAVTDRDGPVTLYSGIDGAQTQSSLMPLENLGIDARPQSVEGVRLDSIAAKLDVPPADFLKLDAEGSEDKILQGGTKMLLENVLGIRIEVSFWKHGSNGASFSEIDRFLTEHGFILFDLQTNRSDIRRIGGRKDKVRSGDALYLKHFDFITQTTSSKCALRTKLLKLMSITVAWKYLNYALELADYGRAKSLLSDAEFTTVTQPWLATVDISDRVPNFWGRSAVARTFDFLSYVFNPSFKKGVPYDFNGLGNHWVVPRAGRKPAQIRLHCPVLKFGRKNRKKVIHISSHPHKGSS